MLTGYISEGSIPIAKEKKMWAALVRELLGHREKEGGKKKKSQERSVVFMIANGYLYHEGAHKPRLRDTNQASKWAW